jgi:hypothetical protein
VEVRARRLALEQRQFSFPAFDDSAWSSMDLHATQDATDAAYGDTGYLTGWSARGFPKLAGFAWYRLRIHPSSASQPVWLKMPDHVDDSYQVFANGNFLGELGRFTPHGVDSYRSRPLVFELPAPDAHGDILLAIRFYMEPWVLVSGSTAESGGMHEAPLVGMRSQIESIRAQEITGRILSIIVPFFVALFMLIVRAAHSGSGSSIARARPICGSRWGSSFWLLPPHPL